MHVESDTIRHQERFGSQLWLNTATAKPEASSAHALKITSKGFGSNFKDFKAVIRHFSCKTK